MNNNSQGAANPARARRMSFAIVYPMYLQKAEGKGRSKAEVDTIIKWLTGYSDEGLKAQIDAGASFEAFFAGAPCMNPNYAKVTGVICGYRVEEITDQVMRYMRSLDKLIDELAKGKPMEKILRT